MISETSEKSGQAVSTRAPRPRNTLLAPGAPPRTSSSTGINPFRSGVQATRQPLIEAAFTARGNWLVSTSYESGFRSSGPAMAVRVSAASATVRAIGPATPRVSQASVRGYDGIRPGVVRRPTTPQNAAGVLREPPRSEP